MCTGTHATPSVNTAKRHGARFCTHAYPADRSSTDTRPDYKPYPVLLRDGDCQRSSVADTYRRVASVASNFQPICAPQCAQTSTWVARGLLCEKIRVIATIHAYARALLKK